jgi:hypothetical protein
VDKWGVEVSKGLFFKRAEDGSVRIHVDQSTVVSDTYVVDGAIWAYAVAYVSRLGPLSPLIEAAKILHEGTE